MVFQFPGLAATLPQWRRESYRVEGPALPLLRDFSSFPLACAPGRKTRKERKPSVFIRSDAHVVRAGLEEAGRKFMVLRLQNKYKVRSHKVS